MDEILTNTYYHNSLKEWLISFLIIFASVIIARATYWLIKRILGRAVARSTTNIDDQILKVIESPVLVFVVLIGVKLGIERLSFPEGFEAWLDKVVFAAFTLTTTWLLDRIADALIQAIIVPITQKTESDFDDHIVPIARKGIRWIIWSIGIIMALNNAGYDVGALIAGLGLGGLALAMAAKDTLANIFGGVTIFADKPFLVNDRIKIDGYDGIVEEVGIRSTRIRTLEGRRLTIPNHFFTDRIVENVTSEPARKVVLQLGLVYSTSPEKMEEAMGILEEIRDKDPDLEDKKWMSFNQFNDSSLGITFMYYIKPGSDIPAVQSRISLQILSQFNAAGLDFAFPTRTIHNVN